MTPKWLKLAQKEIGTKEFSGLTNNPRVVQYFIDATTQKLPDSVPWCAAFVGAILRRAGVLPSGSLAARSYLKWGKKLSKPIVGCVGIWPRGKVWQGHVGFVSSVDEARGIVKLVSGNQDDAVTEAPFRIKTALGWRWPK